MPGKKSNKSKRQTVEEYNCELCDRPDSEEDMVECCQCGKWYHFSCVGVVHMTEEEIWNCPKCIPSHSQAVAQHNPQKDGYIGGPPVVGIPPRVNTLPVDGPASTLRFSEQMTRFIHRTTIMGDQTISQQTTYIQDHTASTPGLGFRRFGPEELINRSRTNVPVIEISSTELVDVSGDQRFDTETTTSPKETELALNLPPLNQQNTEHQNIHPDTPSQRIQDVTIVSIGSDRTNTTIRKNRIELERIMEMKRIEDEFDRQEECQEQIRQERIRQEERQEQIRQERIRQERIRQEERQDQIRREERKARFIREQEYANKVFDLRQEDADSASRMESLTNKSIYNWKNDDQHHANKAQREREEEYKRQREIDKDLEYIKNTFHVGQGDEAASRHGSVSDKDNRIQKWLKECEDAKDPDEIDYEELNLRLKQLNSSEIPQIKKGNIKLPPIQNLPWPIKDPQPTKVIKSNKASQNESYDSEEEKPKDAVGLQKSLKVKKGNDPPSDPSCSGSGSESSSSKKPSKSTKKMIPSWERDVVKKTKVRTLTQNEIASRHVVQKDLDHFWGDPKTWPHFISQLKSTTTMCGFNDDENLNRLNKCLKGKARAKVEHQLDVSGSFKMVMWTLRLIYGRAELIVDELIEKVHKIETPKSDNLESLVDFAMEVNGIISMIIKAELPDHLRNPVLMKELVVKLPIDEKKNWAKYINTHHDASIVEFGEWLKKLAEEVVLVTKPTYTKPKDKDSKPWMKGSRNNRKESDQVCSHQDVKAKAKNKNPKQELPSMGGISARSCYVCKKSCPNITQCDEFRSYDIKRRWWFVKNRSLCKICLRKHYGTCRNYKACGRNGCAYPHHELLHDDNYVFRQNNGAEKAKEKQKPEISNVETPEVNAVHMSKSKVLLKIVPVVLYGGDRLFYTYAFLDDGSTITLIDKKIVDQLKIQGKPTDLCLLWSSKIHRTERDSQEVKISISSIDKGSKKYMLQGVKTVADLGIPAQSINAKEMINKYPYLQGISFVGYENGVPGILIGSNNTKIIVPTNVIEGGECEPVAFETRIGWTIFGSTQTSIKKDSMVYSVKECNCEQDDYMHQAMKDHFSVENFGVQIPNNLARDSKENEKALNQLKTLTKRSGDRFETGLLWKYDSCKLPDSYNMAFKRLQHLEQRKPSDIPKINQNINDYINKGYARKLSESELQHHHERTWYFPIFTVEYPNKPGKIRTVFDARAKTGGTSLNEMLLKGPDQLTSLIDILRRFREKRIAICGDIREMFHQVKIREEDRHCQRFLWRNGDQKRKPDVYVMNVMTFGATCSPSTAQYVKNINAEQFSEEYPEAVKTIIKSHYVDDMMENADDENQAIQLVNEVKKIHANGGFEIRNFLSNSKSVLKAIGSTAEILDKKIINLDELNTKRVLGMWWNTKTDCFTYSLQFMPLKGDIFDKMPTKREMLRILMSVFDPLGLLSHFLIHLKLLVQEIWRSNKKWDEEIDDSRLIDLWHRWLKILFKVEKVQIPRIYSMKLSPNTATSVELHVFVDASAEAFGAVCYLRVENHEGVDVALIGAKSRVAPLKYLSIPRSELQAAVLGTRLTASIISGQNIKINKRTLWSDSATVLLWLKSDHRNYHQFVAHRVGEILENTNMDDWRWIPSKLNPADQLTKWKGEPSFDLTNEWFQGPVFLRLPPENWPMNKCDELADEEVELKMAHSEIRTPQVIDPERFSNWNKMVRSLAHAIRFIKVLRAKVFKQPIKSGIDKEELEQARNIIIRQAQYEEFTEEIETLKFNVRRPVSHQKDLQKSSLLYQLNPYLDEEEIIRMRGMKRPIILPRNHRITRLLVKCYHDCYHCRSNATVVNEIRQKYKIPQIRIVLKSVITKDCQPCKNRRTQPKIPMMADLPQGRVNVGFRAFTATGIDYFGPILVVEGRKNVKRWGVLFTCLTVRAVHIEIAHSLDTESCIMCIGNFTNIRGKPYEFFSDNGTNFVGANNELTEAIKHIDKEAIKNHFELEPYYAKWNFIPAEAKHMAGAWEIMVKAIKTGMLEAIPTLRKPTDEVLRNLLMESMNIVNSRPLTYIPMDDENDEILTPNHFIHGTSNATKPPVYIDLDGPILKSKWQEVQRLTQIFWKRFIKEYLPEITRRSKWYVHVKPLEVGDVVLDVSATNTRNTYPKGRIVEIIMGSNKQVRRVRVQYANRRLLWRGASTLALMDIHRSKDRISGVVSKITAKGEKKYDVLKKAAKGGFTGDKSQ